MRTHSLRNSFLGCSLVWAVRAASGPPVNDSVIMVSREESWTSHSWSAHLNRKPSCFSPGTHGFQKSRSSVFSLECVTPQDQSWTSGLRFWTPEVQREQNQTPIPYFFFFDSSSCRQPPHFLQKNLSIIDPERSPTSVFLNSHTDSQLDLSGDTQDANNSDGTSKLQHAQEWILINILDSVRSTVHGPVRVADDLWELWVSCMGWCGLPNCCLNSLGEVVEQHSTFLWSEISL